MRYLQPTLKMLLDAEQPTIEIYDDIVSNDWYQQEMYICRAACGCESGESCSCDCESDVQMMSPSKFNRLLKDYQGAGEILLKLNTNGGDYGVTLQMIDALKEHPAKIRTRTIGMAYSAGSLLAICGDEREIVQHGQLMLHAPRQMMYGMATAQDLRAELDKIEKATEAMVALYASRSSSSEDEVRTWLSKDTYFSAEEALQSGLVDTILTQDSKPNLQNSTSQPRPPAPAPKHDQQAGPYRTVAQRRAYLAGAGK